jgi:hypothetical protein
MPGLRRSVLIAFSLLAVPAVGLWVTSTVPPVTFRVHFDSNEVAELVPTAWALHIIKLLSKSALLLGGGLVFAIWCVLPIAGLSRNLLSYVFSPFVKMSCAILAILSLGHLAIFSLICWLFGWHYLQYPPYFLTLPILFAAGSAIEVGRDGFEMANPRVERMIGVLLPHDDEPGLWDNLRAIPDRLDATLPDNLVIGFGPGIRARADAVYLAEKEKLDERRLKGGALYISLPMMSVLSVDEFFALLAHALSDLSKPHLIFSKSFVPSVQGLIGSLRNAERKRGLARFILMPARYLPGSIIRSVYGSYARHQRALCQEADQASASVSDGVAAISAQLRCALLAIFWKDQFKYAVEQIERGERPTDFGQIMAAEQIAYLNRVDRVGLRARMEEMGRSVNLDLEPSFLERAAALNVPLQALRIVPSENDKLALSLLEFPRLLDSVASDAFRNILVRTGDAVPPKDPNKLSFVAKKRIARRVQVAARKRSATEDRTESSADQP